MSLPGWTEEEIRILKENYADASPEELPGRGRKAVKDRARKLGLRKAGIARKANLAGRQKGMPHIPWSAEETRILASRYENARKSELMALLPGRSICAIRKKAAKMGLKRSDGARSSSASESMSEAWNGFRDDVQAASGGYGLIRDMDHPKAGRRGLVRSAVIAWEKANGRPVPESYQVFHKDGDRANNDPDNLEIRRLRKMST